MSLPAPFSPQPRQPLIYFRSPWICFSWISHTHGILRHVTLGAWLLPLKMTFSRSTRVAACVSTLNSSSGPNAIPFYRHITFCSFCPNSPKHVQFAPVRQQTVMFIIYSNGGVRKGLHAKAFVREGCKGAVVWDGRDITAEPRCLSFHTCEMGRREDLPSEPVQTSARGQHPARAQVSGLVGLLLSDPCSNGFAPN